VDRTCEKAVREALFSRYPRRCVDVIIDCSGYRKSSVRSVLDSLQVLVQYIYISTDSIYEVCVCQSSQNQPTSEEDCLRPTDVSMRRALASEDKYGNKKKQCEEYLQRMCDDGVVPSCTCLRLADVIGPRDNTDRLWHYVLWLKSLELEEAMEVIKASSGERRLSFTFSLDVARLVLRCMHILEESDVGEESDGARGSGGRAGCSTGGSTDGTMVYYNVACSEMPTHAEFVEAIAQCMGTNLKVHSKTKKNEAGDARRKNQLTKRTVSYYPSTSRGPIDVTKVEALASLSNHKFLLTPLQEAIRQSVCFLEVAMRNGWNESDSKDVIRSLADDLNVVREKEREHFLCTLQAAYGAIGGLKTYPWKKKKKKRNKKQRF